jgi:hypothetical protein
MHKLGLISYILAAFPYLLNTFYILMGIHKHKNLLYVKERVEIYLYVPCVPSWPVLG